MGVLAGRERWVGSICGLGCRVGHDGRGKIRWVSLGPIAVCVRWRSSMSTSLVFVEFVSRYICWTNALHDLF